MTTYLHVGGYTHTSPVGIHSFAYRDGTLEPVSTLTGIDHPSWLAAGPDAATMYAVSETGDAGTIVALRIEGPGLTPIDERPSHGGAPCHLGITADGVFVANYQTGTVAGYAVDLTGRFGRSLGHHQHRGQGPLPRQTSPHAHCVVPGPDGRSVYSNDLGTDRIIHYVVDDTGWRPVDETVMPAASGPRHLTFHPALPIAFAVGELDSSITVLDLDRGSGRLSPRQTLGTVPDDHDGESTAAEVVVHPDGRRIYVSNRGHDSIATFAFDAGTGELSLVGHTSSGGRTPRHFALDPRSELMLVANQESGTIVALRVDGDAGLPEAIGVVAEVPEPSCVLFVEDPS